MKAVGYFKSLPVDDEQSLVDLDMAEPDFGDNDLLVAVAAVSINPIDAKTRLGSPPTDGKPRILGFDAAGTVVKTGAAVKTFKPGDAVFYAGAINRQGSNAELQAIDHRIAALKPHSLDFAAAAALPLTALTAWEMLFERLRVQNPVRPGKNVLLVIGGAGGVGSMAAQLTRLRSELTLVATASRPESAQWARQMGAHHVIDHTKPLAPQLQAHGLEQVDFIFSTANSGGYLPQFAQIITPQGRIGLIDSPADFDIMPLKMKSVSLHWETMFTRSLFNTADISEQGHILAEIAALVDAGKLKPTGVEVMSPLNAATLRAAHRKIETGKSIGKTVVVNT